MKPISNGILTFPYGARYKSGKLHKGLDYRAPTGTPVLASVGGVVVHAGRHIRKSGWGYAFGVHVIVDNVRFIDGSPGYYAGYCHLSKVNVQVGQLVRSGDVLGFSGNTGMSTAPHLHLQILTTRFWNARKHKNPQKWVDA